MVSLKLVVTKLMTRSLKLIKRLVSLQFLKALLPLTCCLTLLTTWGNLDGLTRKVTNIGNPTAAQDAATKSYVDTEVANVVNSAPAALDTLNELAAALGDDANFSTTVTNSLAGKLALAGGTLTGNLTLAGTPTSNLHAATIC